MLLFTAVTPVHGFPKLGEGKDAAAVNGNERMRKANAFYIFPIDFYPRQ